MERTILLQINPTTAKHGRLLEFERKATELANFIISKKVTLYEFHNSSLYRNCKDSSGFNTQVVTAISRVAVKTKGTVVKHITVKFNVPRNCKFFSKSMPFVKLGIYPRNTIAVPIIKNGNWQRYEALLKEGWICKTYGLTADLQIVAYLSKEKVIEPRRNMLGIDINAKHIAISVVSDKGKVLYQTYFGKNIWIKRKDIMRRRSVMQSNKNFDALRRLRHREYDFVDTNIGQMVREIIKLAIRFDADISIEKLQRFKSLGKRFNKKAMRIPFYKIKQILMSRCFDNSITLNIIDSWHTSKWCPKCGAVGKGHDSSNYALFRCKCGLIMNSDRKASYAIAVKCLLERKDSINHKTFQISNRRGLINDLVHSDESSLLRSVNHVNQLDGIPRPLGRV